MLALAFFFWSDERNTELGSFLLLLDNALSHSPVLSLTSLCSRRTSHMCTKFQRFSLLWDPPCLLRWRCCRANACYLWRYPMPVCFGLRGQSLLKSNSCPCPLQPLSLEMATSTCRDCGYLPTVLNVAFISTKYLLKMRTVTSYLQLLLATHVFSTLFHIENMHYFLI